MADSSTDTPQHQSSAPPTTRTEFFLLATLTLLALVIRAVPLSGLAVEHFDEGVYASNLLFPDDGYAFPARHLYAPPLVPSLIEWSIILLGSGRWVPMLPSLLLGAASIPVLWWLSRRWFGGAAAIAAATMLTFSDFHIAFCRSALTDAPLLFFVLLSVGWIDRGLSRQSIWQCGVGGLAAGLAWATKYNGWLALAIAVSGSAAAWLMGRLLAGRTESVAKDLDRSWPSSDRTSALETDPESRAINLRALLVGWLVAVIVAAVVWSPVWLGLQDRGGYAAVAANHRNYVSGWSEWLPSLQRHQAVQKHFAGWFTLLGVVLAPVSAVAVIRAERFTWNENGDSGDRASLVSGTNRSPWNGLSADENSERAPSTGIVVVVSAMMSATVLDPVIVMLIWPLTDWIARVIELRQSKEVAARRTEWLGLWMCLAWIIGLTLATPLYRPYPRLLMLFCGAGWIGIGSAIVRLLTGKLGRNSLSTSRPLRRRLTFIVAALVLLLTLTQTARKGLPGNVARTDLADIASKVRAAIQSDCKDGPSISGVKQLIYVFAEPGLLHHLAGDDVGLGPITDLKLADPNRPPDQLPTYLVAGPHAFASESFDRQFKQVRDSLLPIVNFKYRPSDFVLLDDVAPNQLVERRHQRVQVFRLVARKP